LLENFLN